MQSIISVSRLTKAYATGFHALKSVNLDNRAGEITVWAPSGGSGGRVGVAEQPRSSSWARLQPCGGSGEAVQVARAPAAVPLVLTANACYEPTTNGLILTC